MTFHRRFEPAKKQGRLGICQGAFDIVANDLAIRPGQGIDPFRARLEQGVLDTNAEVTLLPKCVKASNTAALFAASRKQGIEWVFADIGGQALGFADRLVLDGFARNTSGLLLDLHRWGLENLYS